MLVYRDENWYALTEYEWVERIGKYQFNNNIKDNSLIAIDVPEYELFEMDNEIDNKFGDCDF